METTRTRKTIEVPDIVYTNTELSFPARDLVMFLSLRGAGVEWISVSVEEMAAERGYSKATIWAALRELLDRGFVEKESRGGRVKNRLRITAA